MPFTLSHPVAILPLTRTRLSAPALIIGSLSPDFLYFVPYQPETHFTHTLLGGISFCLPVSLLMLLLYEMLLKKPIFSLLPVQPQVQSPKTQFSKANWLEHLGWLIGAILIGAFSHIIWDAFTHDYGFGVALLGLERPVSFLSRQLPLYKLLQYLSTVLGGLVVLTWAVFELRLRSINDIHPHLRLMFALATGIGLLYGASFLPALHAAIVQVSIGTISSGILLLLIYSSLWHLRRFTS